MQVTYIQPDAEIMTIENVQCVNLRQVDMSSHKCIIILDIRTAGNGGVQTVQCLQFQVFPEDD